LQVDTPRYRMIMQQRESVKLIVQGSTEKPKLNDTTVHSNRIEQRYF